MLDIIINIHAGGKKQKQTLKKLALVENHLKSKGVEYKIHQTEYKNHATEITKEIIENGGTDIVVMGGDGSLHEVINGFSNFERVNLGLIPCGTGNDFARSLNLPKDVIKAVEIILNGTPTYTDFMQLPTKRCLNVAGMGLDVDVLLRYEKLKKKTKFGYTSCLLKTLFKYKYTEFSASYNGKNEKKISYIACVANGSCFGGGIKVCPDAEITDGFLDFVTVKNMNKLALLGALVKLKAGKILSLKKAHREKVKEISISSEGDYFVNLDGELYKNIPFEVKVVSNTLKIYR